jgi:hypothetical protein
LCRGNLRQIAWEIFAHENILAVRAEAAAGVLPGVASSSSSAAAAAGPLCAPLNDLVNLGEYGYHHQQQRQQDRPRSYVLSSDELSRTFVPYYRLIQAAKTAASSTASAANDIDLMMVKSNAASVDVDEELESIMRQYDCLPLAPQEAAAASQLPLHQRQSQLLPVERFIWTENIDRRIHNLLLRNVSQHHQNRSSSFGISTVAHNIDNTVAVHHLEEFDEIVENDDG